MSYCEVANMCYAVEESFQQMEQKYCLDSVYIYGSSALVQCLRDSALSTTFAKDAMSVVTFLQVLSKVLTFSSHHSCYITEDLSHTTICRSRFGNDL